MEKRRMDDALNGMNELNERKRKVLWAIVQDYSSTAEPVGSRTIEKKYNLGVSSATIRNEMQDLEDEGYLEQPHASAGRIPSIKGYRYYVDWLMQPSTVTTEEELALEQMLRKHATNSLSVSASSGESSTFNYVRFLPLDNKRAILLVVTDDGAVSDAIVNIPENSSFDEMQLIADKLNRFLHGKNIDGVNESLIMSFQKAVEKDLSSYIPIFNAMNEALAPKNKVYSGGASQLIEQPEFQNVERVQDILNLLEERDILESMLLSSMDKPIAVHIGSENLFKSFSDLSVVRAQFTSHGRVIGSVAVLGPTRMQYSKIIGMMYFMQQRLNTLLKEEE